MGRNGTGDDTAGPDGRTVADGHSGQDDAASPNPHVLPDVDGSGQRFPKMAVRRQAFARVGRVEHGVDMDTRPDAATVAYGDGVAVKEYTVHVDFHIVPEVYVFAVVDKERC